MMLARALLASVVESTRAGHRWVGCRYESCAMTKAISKLYLLAITLVAVIQLLMEADLVVLACLYVVSACAVLVFERKVIRAPDVIYFLFVIYYGLFSLVVKTVLAQPVDENLTSPLNTSLALFLGFASITIGYLLARGQTRFKLTYQFEQNLNHKKTLEWCSLVFFPIGIVFETLHVLLRPVAEVSSAATEGGIGMFGTFAFVTTFAVVCEASLVFDKNGRSSRGIGRLALMLLVILALGIAGNVKQSFLMNFAAVIVVVVVNANRINLWREAIGGGLLAFLLIFYVSPAIHITRGQAKTMPVMDRIELAEDVLAKADYNPFTLQEQLSLTLADIGVSKNPAYNYFFPQTGNYDRFAMIQPINVVVTGWESLGAMDAYDAFQDLGNLLPSFLVGEKTVVASVDRIAWYYGYRKEPIIGRPVMGIVTSSIAVGGIVGALLLTGPFIWLMFWLLDKLCGPLKHNVTGLFLTSVMLLTVEGDLASLFATFSRQMPIILAFLWGVNVLIKFLPSSVGDVSPGPNSGPGRGQASGPGSAPGPHSGLGPRSGPGHGAELGQQGLRRSRLL